ncbi:MAG TPA: GldG family protein [Rariglobus sp.]|jgi:hypothetical protein|nr:GldG family protein [Rariglobus sp.]
MSSPTSFRTVRWVRTLNLLAQAVLFITLFGGLNYLAVHYAWRFDLTQSHRHSLSPETLAYLKKLDVPVRIVVTLTEDNDNDQVVQAYHDVSGLLREYGYATENNDKGRITTEYLDVFQRRRDAEALGIEQANIILVMCGDKRSVVKLDELYDVQDQEKKAFRGEKAITAAILDVSNPTKKKIYFLQGHGEMQLDDVSPARGLSLLKGELVARNFDVQSLDLSTLHKIPDDASVLVIAGPQGRYTPEEENMLRQYLSNRAGRLLALLPPMYPSGLDDLLYEWGILADDVLIYDNGTAGQNENGDLILLPTEAGAKHPVTQKLADYRIPLRFGPSRSVRPDLGRTIDNNLLVTPLVRPDPANSWGERNYRERGTAVFDKNIDLPGGDLVVVTSSERVTPKGNLDFSVPGGRVVAFGSADWIANTRLGVIGNLTLFMSAIDWATDRNADLSVPVRPINKFQLSLSQGQLRHLRYSLFFLLPGAAALLGAIVYWTRRS